MNIAAALAFLALNVPLPSGVTVVEQRCAVRPDAASCADIVHKTVYLAPEDEREGWRPAHYILAHELGHLWDFEHMDDARRAAFSSMVGLPFTPVAWFYQATRTSAPGDEQFADAYALCALGPKYRRWDQRSFGDATHYGGGYAPLPKRVVAATCWLLDHPPR
jgi:hypothetical protein